MMSGIMCNKTLQALIFMFRNWFYGSWFYFPDEVLWPSQQFLDVQWDQAMTQTEYAPWCLTWHTLKTSLPTPEHSHHFWIYLAVWVKGWWYWHLYFQRGELRAFFCFIYAVFANLLSYVYKLMVFHFKPMCLRRDTLCWSLLCSEWFVLGLNSSSFCCVVTGFLILCGIMSLLSEAMLLRACRCVSSGGRVCAFWNVCVLVPL